jgi:hypothetical protein
MSVLLIKDCAMKIHREVVAQLHAFIISKAE